MRNYYTQENVWRKRERIKMMEGKTSEKSYNCTPQIKDKLGETCSIHGNTRNAKPEDREPH